jgi:hypothetical protein
MEIINILMKISSKYILGEIFSFIDYNRTKKLIKYNLKLLERLDMKLEDYTLTFKYSVKEIKESLSSNSGKDTETWRIIIIAIIVIMNIILFISWATGFLEEHSDKWAKFEVILSIVFYFFLLVLFFISFFYMVCCNCHCHYDRSCLIFMVIINILNVIGFILNIMKIAMDLHYKSETNIINLICDFLLLILFPFLIILYFIYINKCKKMLGSDSKLKIIINEFRGFKVNDYILDINFKNNSREEQKEILLNCNFKYTLSEELIELIKSINEFRINNNLEILKYKYNEDLNDYFVITNTKKFPKFKNIIEIDENKYLFIYPIYMFESNFANDDLNILNILKIQTLNRILIFETQRNQHILVYDSRKIYGTKVNLHNNITIARETERSIDILNEKNA